MRGRYESSIRDDGGIDIEVPYMVLDLDYWQVRSAALTILQVLWENRICCSDS